MDSVIGDQVLPIAFMVSSTASANRCGDHDSFLSTLYDRFNELLNGRFVIITGQSLCFTPDAFPVSLFFSLISHSSELFLNFLSFTLNLI